ncbi:MAG: pectate lyase [Verrucomicrobiota bacterium]
MKRWLAVGVGLVCAGGLRAAEPADLKAEAAATLARATTYMQSISARGGYLWSYSLDLQKRAGESIAPAELIWVQNPGTAAMGMSFLRSYAATKDVRYLHAARDVAEALAVGQLASGGWHYSVDMVNPENNRDGLLDYKGKNFAKAKPGKHINPHYTIMSTYDDDNTQSAVRFLLACVAATKGSETPRDRAIRAMLDRALEGMLRAQYRNGAWPQRFDGKPRDPAAHAPKKASIPKEYPRTWSEAFDYTGNYTLNDDTQYDFIRTLLEAGKQLGDPRYVAAAKRGGEWLVRAQLPEPQAAWAQQYNEAMEPSWARAFEPPAIASNESGSALRALVLLYRETGDRSYLKPIAAAVAWIERSALAAGRWARMYELGTNRPIYGDVDGNLHYTLAELTPERRNGYGWEGEFHLPAVLAECRAALAEQGKPVVREGKRPAPLAKREAAAREAIAALDAEGRWIKSGRITKRAPEEPLVTTSEYMRRAGALSDYLESVGGK